MPRIPIMINGKNYDWATITAVILGVPIIGITDISYDVDRASTNNYGAGDNPVGYGNKNFVYGGGSMNIYKEEQMQIEKVAPNKNLLEIPPFTITVIFSGDGVTFTTDKISNVRFTKRSFAAKQGDAMLMAKTPFEFAGLQTL